MQRGMTSHLTRYGNHPRFSQTGISQILTGHPLLEIYMAAFMKHDLSLILLWNTLYATLLPGALAQETISASLTWMVFIHVSNISSISSLASSKLHSWCSTALTPET